MPQFADRRIETLLTAARAGASAALAVQSSAVVGHKGDFDLVTNGDRDSQAATIKELVKPFPGIEIVAEEKENAAALPATCLVIDPIDGTTRYSKGARDWGVLVGLIENNEPKLGVILQPRTGVTALAVKGEGCFIDSKRVRFSETTTLKSSILASEIGPFAEQSASAKIIRVASTCTLGLSSVLSCVGNGLELLQGITGIYVQPGGAKIWDILPLVIATREAGGFVCDDLGAPLKLDRMRYGTVIFASSENIAQEFIKKFHDRRLMTGV